MSTNDNTKILITRHEAIEFAAKYDLTLSKAADPIEGFRDNLTVAEARVVASEDPSLIFLALPEAEFDRLTREEFSRDRLGDSMVQLRSMLDHIHEVHSFGDFWPLKRRLEEELERAMQAKASMLSAKGERP